MGTLPDKEKRALLATSSRIATAGLPRGLGDPQVDDDAPVEVRLLLGHYSNDPAALFDDDLIIEAPALGSGSWPPAHAAGERFRKDPSPDTSRLVSAFGTGPTEVPLEREMPANVAEHMLLNPSAFSLGWLVAADRSPRPGTRHLSRNTLMSLGASDPTFPTCGSTAPVPSGWLHSPSSPLLIGCLRLPRCGSVEALLVVAREHPSGGVHPSVITYCAIAQRRTCRASNAATGLVCGR